ncbi:hypothetical protein BGW80DRAFT_374511 [Lactifluus volemus]|nr:hypothetical protein BGW80DRAFT_374511 [Lactifluus volemus]
MKQQKKKEMENLDLGKCGGLQTSQHTLLLSPLPSTARRASSSRTIPRAQRTERPVPLPLPFPLPVPDGGDGDLLSMPSPSRPRLAACLRRRPSYTSSLPSDSPPPPPPPPPSAIATSSGDPRPVLPVRCFVSCVTSLESSWAMQWSLQVCNAFPKLICVWHLTDHGHR